MREGSKFVGTKQDLEDTIHKYLPKFISDFFWLSTIEENVSKQEFTNICEAIAEAINRGYINEKVNVHYMMNGTISFSTMHTTPDNDSDSLTLSELGKQFMEM